MLMKQLFVPACLCLMATAPIGTESNFNELSGTSIVKKSEQAPSAPDTEEAAIVQIEPDSDDSEAPAPGSTAQDSLAKAAQEEQKEDAQESAQESTQDNKQAKLEPPPAKKIKPVIYRSRREVCDTLAKAAQHNDLPAPFFIRLLFQESGFRPGIVSRAGAQGVAQFMPDTADDMGLDNPFDPVQAIPASARLLHSLFEQFGNLGLAAAAYNAGAKRVQDWLAKKSKLPEETQGYVKIVTGRPAESWKTAASVNAEMRLPRHAPCQEAAGLMAWNGPREIPVPPLSPQAREKATRVAARDTHAPKRAHDDKRVVQLSARKHPVKEARHTQPAEQHKKSRKTARKSVEVAMAGHSAHR